MFGLGRSSTRIVSLTFPLLLAIVALALGLALHPLAVDDAYITFRFARNLAAGNGFTYNAGRAILSTTAPLYALLLASGALVWPDLPALANSISTVALWLAAALISIEGRREGTPWVGALAALLLVAYPLLWLSLGLETAVFLALSLAAVVSYRRNRLFAAAVLLAVATMTRADGLILAAVLAGDYLLPRLRALLLRQGDRRGVPGMELVLGDAHESGPAWRTALAAACVYIVALLPLVVWLTWQFGSPLPVTLGAKMAQSGLGVTGFYAHTTTLQGVGILARARLAQTPLYGLFIPALLVGLTVMWRQRSWLRLITAWALAHLAAYVILGVTPYYWYYAPLVPALVCTSALGVIECARWLAARWEGRHTLAWGLAGLWALALVASLAWSDLAMVRALDDPVPPPEDPVSKVLPEAKTRPYQRAGQWLHEQTPADALVGVTEVGIMGYYADRTMVDFLGILEPDVAEALARGDLYWALLRYQPDYLALTAVSPLYAYDLRADPWFQAAYHPVQTVEDPRFWGSPVTIYQRAVERIVLTESASGGLPEGAIRLDVDLGPIRLLGAVADQAVIRPGDVLALTLFWQALQPSSGVAERAVPIDYTVFVHLLGQHDRVLAQRDATPGLGSRPTSQWEPGQVVADPYLLALPEAAFTPDEAVWEVGLYDASTGQRLTAADGADNVRFGSISVRPASGQLKLRFGATTLTGYELDRVALTPGDTLAVQLRWQDTTPAIVTVQLVDEAGKVATQASGTPDQGPYHLTMGPDAVPGAYDLEVLVADPVTGNPLPLLGADGQPRGDQVRLTKVRLYP